MSQIDYDYVYPLSGDVRMLFNVVYSTVLVIGVLGNIMVIVVILSTKEMRNSTNIFLVNLATADIMTLLMWGSESLSGLNSKWPFGGIEDQSEEICKALTFMEDVMAYVSVLTILAIGFERYYAICQPLKAAYICTKKRACGICLLVWAIAALSSSPVLFSNTYKLEDKICVGESTTLLDTVYYVTSVPVLTFLPLIILVILFLIIFRNLRQAVAPSVNTAAMRHRRRVISMLATVVFCFFLCHLPYRSFVFFDWLLEYDLSAELHNGIFFFCSFMLFLHSAVNPILYNFMSERFRVAFKNITCDTVHKLNSWSRNWCVRREETNPTLTPMAI